MKSSISKLAIISAALLLSASSASAQILPGGDDDCVLNMSTVHFEITSNTQQPDGLYIATCEGYFLTPAEHRPSVYNATSIPRIYASEAEGACFNALGAIMLEHAFGNELLCPSGNGDGRDGDGGGLGTVQGGGLGAF